MRPRIDTTMSSYAQPSDLLARYDNRVLGDLVSDTGTRQTPTQLLTDPNLQAALNDGAGEINAAALVGERYAVTDLQALTGVDQALLIRINCDLAFYYLALRRGIPLNELQKQQYERATKLLGQIRAGDRIFNVAADVAAGTPDTHFPTSVAYENLNLLRDAAGRMFPVRRQQTPQSS